MIAFTITVLRLFKWLIRLFNVDYTLLETIIRAKLTIDIRRSPSIMQSSSKKQTFARQLILFSIMGIFVGMGFFAFTDVMLSFLVSYSVIMVMICTTLITEFTSVLFDERDNNIILPRPVDNKTLVASRLLHIQIYIGYIALALALVSSIIVGIKYGFFVFIGYFIGVGITAWIALLITTFFYLILARIVNAERFNNIITYVQVFLMIFIFAGYQLIPRLMDSDVIQEASLTITWHTYLVPPAWIAGFAKMFFMEVPDINTIILFLIAIIMAIGGGIITIRFLSRDFSGIISASQSKSTPVVKNVKSRRTKI